jgi:beta-phosphoglucomutase
MIRAVIFDLDGVIVSTDELHYRSWQRLADEEEVPFDRTINERLRGIDRMASLAIVLERSTRSYTVGERKVLADRKNSYYLELLGELTPASLLPGANSMLSQLKRRGVPMALASSSRNTRPILERLELGGLFDVVVDGNDVTRTKPDPELFLLAARRLNVRPPACLVVEDAASGVEAARRAGMRVLGVGAADRLSQVDRGVRRLTEISVDELLRVGGAV